MILPKALAPTFTKFLGRISPEAETTEVMLCRETRPVCTVTTPSFFLCMVKPTTAASSSTMPTTIAIFFFNFMSVDFDAQLPNRRATLVRRKLHYIVCSCLLVSAFVSRYGRKSGRVPIKDRYSGRENKANFDPASLQSSSYPTYN